MLIGRAAEEFVNGGEAAEFLGKRRARFQIDRTIEVNHGFDRERVFSKEGARCGQPGSRRGPERQLATGGMSTNKDAVEIEGVFGGDGPEEIDRLRDIV